MRLRRPGRWRGRRRLRRRSDGRTADLVGDPHDQPRGRVDDRRESDALDYLDGEAVGATGGRPRHQVEVEAGYYNNGLGARLSADWRSATRVDRRRRKRRPALLVATPRSTCACSPTSASASTWFRSTRGCVGSSVRFEVDNIFDAQPKVRDANGDIPFSYQPDLLEPIGRTVGDQLRKLFLPSASSARRRGPGRKAGGTLPARPYLALLAMSIESITTCGPPRHRPTCRPAPISRVPGPCSG